MKQIRAPVINKLMHAKSLAPNAISFIGQAHLLPGLGWNPRIPEEEEASMKDSSYIWTAIPKTAKWRG